jgi:hypothetical protein
MFDLPMLATCSHVYRNELITGIISTAQVTSAMVKY